MPKSQRLSNLPNAPAFSAYRTSSDQSVTTSTWTKVQCQTEEFDTASAYDNATNYRFTPQVSGYYQITGQICPAGVPATRGIVAIYKNGTRHKVGSDYVEMWGFVTASSGPGFAFSSTGQDTYFQGVLIGPAA